MLWGYFESERVIFLFWFTLIFGCSMLLGHSKISEWYVEPVLPEFLVDFIECAQCTGFWLGIVAGFFIFSPTAIFFHLEGWWVILDGLAASGVNFILYAAVAAFSHIGICANALTTSFKQYSSSQPALPDKDRSAKPCCDEEKSAPVGIFHQQEKP